MYILYFELDKIYCKMYLRRAISILCNWSNLNDRFQADRVYAESPFIPKYNYYYINNDDEGMRKFYLSHLSVVSPFVFIPAIVCVMLMPQFILAWVGEKFVPSVAVAQMLVGAFFLLL